MASTVLTENLGEAFTLRAGPSAEVCFASAWVTPNPALDALLTSDSKVKALVGTHGNATDPSCLEKILDGFGRRCLRIVGAGGPLFHPKLYLFRSPGERAIAWVGSANFTGAGFKSNREIVLESDDPGVVKPLEAWFRAERRRLGKQDVMAELSAYRERHSVGLGDLTTVVGSVRSPVPRKADRVVRMQLKPAGRRRVGAPYSGEIVVFFCGAHPKQEALHVSDGRLMCCLGVAARERRASPRKVLAGRSSVPPEPSGWRSQSVPCTRPTRLER